MFFLGCPSDAFYAFGGSCYQLMTSDAPLTWTAAESQCQQSGAHLVSIGSRTEMDFLHYMLTTQWLANQTLTFIGKKFNNNRAEKKII